jgi:ABC-type polysaccharide/polyol phosphate export permease
MGDSNKPAITKETFKELKQTDKLNIMYDYIIEMHRKIFTLEESKMRNTMYAGAFGFIGGAVAVLSTKLGSFFNI